MTRAWTRALDLVDGVLSLPLAFLILFVAAIVLGLALYFWPRWIPRRPHWRRRGARTRLRRLRWRWPSWDWRAWLRIDWRFWRWFRRPVTVRRATDDQPDDEPEPVRPASEEGLPVLVAEDLSTLADRLAAQGRYAEAVRERLRAMVRLLVERGVLAHRPGWTVTELARAAAVARPAVAPPLDSAADVFSGIWYAQHPADASADQRMRELAAQVEAGTGAAG